MAADPSRVLVLGAGGFIGSHLCRALAGTGAAVTAYGRPGQADADDGGWRGAGRIERIVADFADRPALARALEGGPLVYHLIGSTSPAQSNADPAADLTGTVINTIAFLDMAVAAGVPRVVFVSSGGTVYGIRSRMPIAEDDPVEPICAYGINKLTVERYLHLYHHLHGLDYCVLRAANPFGEGQTSRRQQGVVAAFTAAAVRGEPLVLWGDGGVTRDYIHIDDMIGALLLAGHTGHLKHRIMNIGSGQSRSVRDVADAVEQAVGRPLLRDIRPGRPVDVPAVVLDIARARDTLGWQPHVSWEEGIARTVRWQAQRAGGRVAAL